METMTKKAVTFARQLGAPVIGIIENMSGFVCPKCGAEIKHLQNLRPAGDALRNQLIFTVSKTIREVAETKEVIK